MILNKTFFRFFAVLGLYCLVASVTKVLAAPESDLWPFWDRAASYVEGSERQLDHSAWQQVLDQYLVMDHSAGIHLADYARLAEPGNAGFDTLAAYINDLESIDPRTLVKAEQFAYWVNLYNAATVRLIVEEYPIKSIRRAGRGFFSIGGPWDDELLTIAGQDVTLNDIEHRILRPIWKDPRIHFVVNCASIGCPNLDPIVFTGANYDALSDKARDAFINHPRGVSVDGNRITLSSIFDWYEIDFGADRDEMLQYVIEHSKTEQAIQIRQAMLVDSLTVSYAYDWSLNEANASSQ